ncbi:MAG: preprotein translocase subunit SecG [Candidatus Absconditicoccaceae bacterium]|nr:MAG: preprotein translocase subunit SecG [Candidatus Gracilibacteria bacterium]
MRTLLIIAMLITGIVFIASVLLQSPKGGGIGMGLGGASAGGNEYGSKKTMEGKLKKIALISGVLFVIIVLFLPYVR